MVVRVGNVQKPSVEGHALRIAETGLREKTVLQAGVPAADDFICGLAGKVMDDDAVMSGVGDEESRRLRVGEDLSREEQKRIGRGFSAERKSAPVDKSLWVQRRQDLADQPVERLEDRLSGQGAHHLAQGVDQHESRPGRDPVEIPDRKIPVVDHGVPDALTEDGLANGRGLALGGVFGRMHADDGEFRGVLVLQALQVGEDVHAVDAAGGPEIQDHDLAAQAGERKGPLDIQPLQLCREFRRVRARCRFRHDPPV